MFYVYGYEVNIKGHHSSKKGYVMARKGYEEKWFVKGH